MPLSEDSKMRCLNIAAYKFASLGELPRRRKELRECVDRLNLRGTILLSPEGINLFIAGTEDACEQLLVEIQTDPLLEPLDVKRSWTDYQPFNRALVKIKKEIIAFGLDEVKPAVRTSPKLSPAELKQWLDEGRPVTMLDTRNTYEIDLGTFKNAVDLKIRHFRDFPKAISQLPQETKANPIVMFCTGGIRCEKAGPYMEMAGFDNVYQLDGGILNYFEQCGSAHYQGDCFVFDQRVSVQPDLRASGAKYCFACQHTLNADDLASEKYRIAEYCPYCFESSEEAKSEQLRARHEKLQQYIAIPPGTLPYENRRPMFVAGKHAGKSLIDWLCEMHAGLDRMYWEKEIQNHRIVYGPTLESASLVALETRLVKEGERYIHIEPECVEPPVNAAIEFIFEDDALVVVSKPAKLPSHASGRYCRNTLEYILAQLFPKERLRLAHRLDAETSGVVVLTRKQRYASLVQRQFQNGQVDKVYLAHIHGLPMEDRFECTARISDTPGEEGIRYVDPQGGQECFTAFQVLERFENTTLVAIKPYTGRTNQIRVHLKHLGHPIVGDPVYGDAVMRGEKLSIRQNSASEFDGTMRLHAWRLTLRHPQNRKMNTYEASIPSWASAANKTQVDFDSVDNALRNASTKDSTKNLANADSRF